MIYFNLYVSFAFVGLIFGLIKMYAMFQDGSITMIGEITTRQNLFMIYSLFAGMFGQAILWPLTLALFLATRGWQPLKQDFSATVPEYRIPKSMPSKDELQEHLTQSSEKFWNAIVAVGQNDPHPPDRISLAYFLMTFAWSQVSSAWQVDGLYESEASRFFIAQATSITRMKIANDPVDIQ